MKFNRLLASGISVAGDKVKIVLDTGRQGRLTRAAAGAVVARRRWTTIRLLIEPSPNRPRRLIGQGRLSGA